MNADELRKTFLNFWKSSPRNHKEVPNVSLVPQVDSTLLFVNSGMFPLAPYLAGQPHPLGTRLCNVQRCLRTKYDDMMEIGDNRHTSMFEMMGNWSLGDYFKKEQIPWVLELHVKHYGLDPNRLYVSIWKGNDIVPRDDEAIEIWKEAFAKYGVKAEYTDDITKVPDSIKKSKNHNFRIFPYGEKDNWWQRGEAPGELGGPTTEIFYDTGELTNWQSGGHINDDSGRFIEIGNSVFMQYILDDNMQWQPLKQKNVDFGGGLERILMCIQGKTDIFETDLYQNIISQISQLCKREYKEEQWKRLFRIVADHGRAATFILADGVLPSNKDQGYILRRFIRRLVVVGDKLGLKEGFTEKVATAVIDVTKNAYPHLVQNKKVILEEMAKEEEKFRKTLLRGVAEIEKMRNAGEKINGQKAFYIYETFGFPLELTLSELNVDEAEAANIEKDFKKEVDKHRELSRKGAEKKFKGGLADHTKEQVSYHTATHLLLAALQHVLGKFVHQRGSNITNERLRFDFSYDKKLTEEQVKKVKDFVNNAINNKLQVVRVEMPKTEAEKLDAEQEFGQKYPEIVSIYIIGDIPSEVEVTANNIKEVLRKYDIVSVEFCGGPHVENTGKLKEMGWFKIVKQESVGSGIRRIKAILQ